MPIVALALAARGRQRQLAALLPIRRRRSLVARLALAQCQQAAREAEATLVKARALASRAEARRVAARLTLTELIRAGSVGARVTNAHGRIEWLDDDWKRAQSEANLAGEARDRAIARLDASRRRLLAQDERVRQLEQLIARTRLLDDRRVALRQEVAFAERLAADQRRRVDESAS